MTEFPVTKRGDEIQKGDVIDDRIVIVESPYRTTLSDEELKKFTDDLAKRGLSVTDEELETGVLKAPFVGAGVLGELTFVSYSKFEVTESRLETLERAEHGERVTVAAQQLQILRGLGAGDVTLTIPYKDGSGLVINVVKTEIGETATFNYTSADGEHAGGVDVLDEVLELLREAEELRESIAAAMASTSHVPDNETLSILRATEGQKPA